MNDRLATIAIRVFLLDHGRPIAGLAFLNDSGAITVTVVIVGFANCYAGSNRSHANANIVSKRRSRHGTNHGYSKQRFLHVPSSWISMVGKCRVLLFVPIKN